MESIKVSVCIPTYNQSRFIEQAVRSAANQTTPPQEIIVSDDCSTDNTASILEQLASEIKQIKVVRQSVNLGIVKNNDYCLRLAQGQYIVRLDSDDYLHPLFIERLLEYLKKHPNAGYAHAAVQEINQSGQFTRIRSVSRSAGNINGDQALRNAMCGYKVAANIVMFKKEALEKVGYMQATVNFAEDYFLSAAIAAAGYGNVYCNEVLSYYRLWTDVGMVRQKRKLAEIMGLRSVFADMLEPAFEKRGWSKKILYKKRDDFACAQSDALGWAIYTDKEKQQLKEELYKLAYYKPLRFRLLIWLYENGYASMIEHFRNIVSAPKRLAKLLLR